jgi:hypothetical protein
MTRATGATGEQRFGGNRSKPILSTGRTSRNLPLSRYLRGLPSKDVKIDQANTHSHFSTPPW